MASNLPKLNTQAFEQVYRMLIEGHRVEDITSAIKSQWPKQDTQKLITQAVEKFALTSKCDRSVLIGWAFEAYREIYRQLMLSGNPEGALKAVKELTALEAKHRVLDGEEEAEYRQKANTQLRD